MEFTYSKMWHWFTDAHGSASYPATDDIIVRIYDANHTAKKYGNGREMPFTHPGVKVSRVNDEIITKSVHPMMFRRGLFVVSENTEANEQAKHKALRRKNLFFVFPVEKREGSIGGEGRTILAADHFSFCLDKSDKNTPLHFHLTSYQPESTFPGFGSTTHLNNYLPAAFTLPIASDAFLVSDFLKTDLFRAYGVFIHALLSRDWLSPPPVRQQQQQQLGGTKNRRQKQKQRARCAGPLSFREAWSALPLHKLIMIAAKRADGAYDVTLVIYDRLLGGKSELSRQSWGFVGVPAETVMSEAALEDEVARTYLSTLTWDMFRPGNPVHVLAQFWAEAQ